MRVAPPEPSAIVRPSRIVPWQVAKAGLLVNGAYCRNSFIGGFSMAQDADRAVAIARAEVLERLHALYDVAKDNLIEGRFFPALSWPELQDDGLIAADRCVLGAHPFGAPPYLDATGLAYHRDLRSAARHAVCEVLERHFAAAVWYDSEPVVEHLPPVPVHADHTARLFTLANRPHLPFVIAVFAGSSAFTGAGSCFGPTLASARAHALKEAAMLLDGYLEGDRGACASSAARVLSLRDAEFGRARISHFEKGLVGTTSRDLEAETAAIDDETILAYLVSRKRPRIGVITTLTEGVVVRAVVEDLPGLLSRRGNSPDKPSDWYC